MSGVGIVGLGVFLPEHMRGNDWWPADEVERWREGTSHRVTRGDGGAAPELTEGQRRTLAAMAAHADDPFRGSRERRIKDPDMTVAAMEAAAGRAAIERAGITPDQIDVVLAQTPVPDQLMVNSACGAHRELGLREDCLTIGTEGACNAFAQHLTLARALVASGAARHVLSLHSSAITRVHGFVQPHAAWWGDGAAAAVIGPVPADRGLLAATHYTDGRHDRALALGAELGEWWEGHPLTTRTVDRDDARHMMLALVDCSRDAIHAALAQAGLAPADVGFYASHQGTTWLAQVTAEHSGLAHADTIVTFPRYGNLNSANVPVILAEADREGRIVDGTVVVTFSGGLGETWSATVHRWAGRP